jgi:hypothetical protein
MFFAGKSGSVAAQETRGVGAPKVDIFVDVFNGQDCAEAQR